MTDHPDLTPEVRDAIARLCGGELRHDEEDGEWWFFPLGKRTDGTTYGATAAPDEWLPARYVGSHDELVQESILLRWLARAGVAEHTAPVEMMLEEDGYGDDVRWRANPGRKVRGGGWFYGPTPIAALVALAAAHVDARKEGKE